MLGFLLIIVTTVSIIGYAEIDYVSNQAYNQNYQRMESYAETLGELASSQSQNGTAELSTDFLNKLQFVLRGDDVHFRIFNAKNEQIYPATRNRIQLSDRVLSTLKRGEQIRIRNNNLQRSYIGRTKDAYTGVLVPWMNGTKMIGVIWIGSLVKNVEKPIYMAKRNLLNALMVTIIVGLILSFILSYYSTTKIKSLSRATKKVAAGDFNVQIKNKGNDEIDQLAENFNRMVRTLKNLMKRLKLRKKGEISLWRTRLMK